MTVKGKIVIASFYRLVPVPDFEELKKPLLEMCNSLGLKGTILLAKEGINGTVSGTRENMDGFFENLGEDIRFSEMEKKENMADFQPFERMKVRLKKEVVRMGVDNLNIEDRGSYIEPEDWDELINDPEVVVVDTRNDYEYLLGRFKNAIDPRTKEFRSFPKWVDENLDPEKNKKVAMYCTGGIRCEKSTALLKQKGFEEVYHLKGGILEYLEKTGNKSGMWEGNCFVFDERIAVNDCLKPASEHLCKMCGKKVTVDEIKTSNQKGITCESCLEQKTALN